MSPLNGRQAPWRTVAPLALLAIGFGAALVLSSLVNRVPALQPLGFYGTGAATLSIDGASADRLTLDEHGATLFSRGGAGLTWTSTDGWFLSLHGPSDSTPPEATGTLQWDGGDFHGWAGIDSKACAIRYSTVEPTRIAGSVRCHGLIWYDKSSIENVRPLDRSPFDLDVDFEATGDGSLPSASAP